MGLKDRLEEDRASEGRADRGSVTHWRRRLLAEINLEDLTRLTLAQIGRASWRERGCQYV